MAECRICLNSVKGKLVSPCRCKGSIMYIHQTCLSKWLKEKYPKEVRGLLMSHGNNVTGMQCELCKYEFRLNSKYLRPSQILKKLQSSRQIYNVLINIPIIIFLIYKSSNLLRHLLLFLYSLTLKNNKPHDILSKLLRFINLYFTFLTKLLPISLILTVLPIFIQSTIKPLKKLYLECQDLQIENIL